MTLQRINRAAAAATLVALVVVGVALAAPPTAPKVSTFAPAKDLEGQVDAYIGRLEESVKDESEYKDASAKVTKEASALAVIALAVGLHDEDSKYKPAAAGLVKAAQELAQASDFAAAKAGVAALKKAAEATDGDASKMKWEKVASLEQLMKQVPLVDSRLRRNLRTEKSFKSKAKDNVGDSAVLAVIAQASIADTSEAKGDAQVEQWYKFCEQMRDAAAKVNAEIHGGKFAALQASMKALKKSCDDCHAVFHTEGLDSGESEK